LEVVVLSDHAEELVEKVVRLALGETIDVLNVVTNSKDGLPASDWIGADNRVFGGEFITNVERVTARISVELELLVLGGLSEERLGVGGGKAIKELLVGWGETVIDFVSGCPESV
jgi:hypothetical protein